MLELVHQEGQHHQMHEYGTQMFFAQAVIVAEIVALILERVEGFVLYPPAGSAAAHELIDILLGDFDVRHPTKALQDFWLFALPVLNLPVLKKVDP